MPNRPFFLAALACLAASVCGSSAAPGSPKSAPLAELQALGPLSLDLTSPTTTIVSPTTPAYEPIAQRLADDLQRSTGRRPTIRPGTTPARELGAGPLISLGNLMDSALGRRLYLDAYDFTDNAWPSPGGHVLRTVRDPLGTGAHVLVVGGSDPAGVADAAADLARLVETRGSRLGYLNRVKLGRLAVQIKRYTESLLGDDVKRWNRVGGSGSWDHQIAITKAAIGYLRTADEAYLAGFRSELRYWFDHDVFQPGSEAPMMLHGHLNMLLMAWDLVADHPSFSPEERRRIDADFLAAFRTPEGPDRIAGESRTRAVRSNHSTRTGLDAYFGGRYFARRYRLEDGRRWMAIADGMFAPMLQSAKPGEDSWGHQWACSLFNTVIYALAAGKDEFLRSSVLKQAADRALIAHLYANPPFVYLAACAVATGDTGYLSSFPENDLARLGAGMHGQGDEYLRSFVTGRPVVPRRDLLGVAVAPLAQRWYETYEGGTKGDGFFVINQPLEACFDKISLREGWKPGDFYLLLDGISGGVHAYQNANCIVHLADQGINWLTGTYQFTGSATVRGENGVFVGIDAAGPGQVHRYARRLYSGEAGSRAAAGSIGPWLAVGAALEGLGGVDWQRHILRRCGRWTLVIDVALPNRTGEALVERHWHTGARVQTQSDGVTCLVNQQTLHLQTAGVAPDAMRGSKDRAEIVRQAVAAGQPVAIAALLHLNRTPQQRDVTIRRTSRAWRVDDADATFFVLVNTQRPEGVAIVSRQSVDVIGTKPRDLPSYHELTADKDAPAPAPLLPVADEVRLPWRELRVGSAAVTAVARGPHGAIATGDAQGNVHVFRQSEKPTLVARLPSAVISLHLLGDDLLVGEDRGAISRLAPNGTPRWEHVIPYVSLPWAYWGEGRSRIREIDTADLAGNGQTQILLANADRRVYALDENGKELWKAPVEWGVFTAMTVGQFSGRPALIGGTSRPAIHGWCVILGNGGKLLGHYSRPDLNNWSNPSQFRDLRLADLNGDGRPEAVAAIDTDCRQLVAYQPDGKILWDADVAGAAEAVAVRPARAGQAAQVYCASNSGYVCGFDGPTGKRRFAVFVGPPTNFVAPLADGRVLAVAPKGDVFVIGNDGKLAGRSSAGSQITALLRPGDHRAANAVILGTHDGRVLVLAD